MITVNTQTPLAKDITAIRAKRTSLIQDWHHAKMCALERADNASPIDRKKITRHLSNDWFDEPDVMAINDCIDLTWKIEAELKETQKVLTVCPPPAPIESATVNELWTHYRIERDAADPLTPGHTMAKAWGRYLTNQQPTPITITLAPNRDGVYHWSAEGAALCAEELRHDLCRAVASASAAKPVDLDLPLFATELHQLIETARQDVLCAVAGILNLWGAPVEEVGSKIDATGRLTLLQIDDVLQCCNNAAIELATPSAVAAEISRWLSTGTGLLPNLFGMALDVLIGLCVLSRNMCRLENLDANKQAVVLANQVRALHDTLRDAAIRVALTDPDHSDFSQWLWQHATVTNSLALKPQ